MFRDIVREVLLRMGNVTAQRKAFDCLVTGQLISAEVHCMNNVQDFIVYNLVN
jgi:hypothetical protein